MFTVQQRLRQVQSKSLQVLTQQPKRGFQTFGGAYRSGFDRMISDKIGWTGINGHWFALFGVANLLGFGLSQVMERKNFEYYFAYKGEGTFFQPFRSMIASDKFSNVVWTAPSLILGGAYLQKQLGGVFMTKFFITALIANYAFMSAFGPGTFFYKYNLRAYIPDSLRFDCIPNDSRHYLGADMMAANVLYLALFYHRYYLLGAGFFALDVAAYGLHGAVGASAAAYTALSLL